MEDLIKYIETLETGSFAGWTTAEKNAYLTACTSIKEKAKTLEVNKEDLFEHFTTVRWVKWSKRKPTHNGSVYMRFNGKNSSVGFVFNGALRKLEGLANSEFENYEDTFYWLEELVDVETFSKYLDSLDFNLKK